MESGSKNPLLINHIVEKVFSNPCFSDSDLLNLRSVCREWDEAATKTFRLKVWLGEEGDQGRMVRAISLLQNLQGNLPIIKHLVLSRDFFTEVPGFQAALGKFLSLVSKQIEELNVDMDAHCKLFFNDNCYCDVLSFPRLKVLELTMQFWNSSDVKPASYSALPFPSIFPKVSELRIRGIRHHTEQVMSALFPNGFAAPNVQSLYLELYCVWLRFAQFRNLAQGFTGLKKLSIVKSENSCSFVGQSSISVIFEWCLLLEDLDVVLGVWATCDLDDNFEDYDESWIDVDSCLTGIPTLVCQKWRSAPNSDWTGMEIAAVKERPGLSDLKKLKNLEVRSCHSAKLTNVTGYFGFLQLPKLEKLFTENFQMSEEFILSLKSRFGENSISTTPLHDD